MTIPSAIPRGAEEARQAHQADMNSRRMPLRQRWVAPPEPPWWQRLLGGLALVAIVLFAGVFLFPNDVGAGASGGKKTKTPTQTRAVPSPAPASR